MGRSLFTSQMYVPCDEDVNSRMFGDGYVHVNYASLYMCISNVSNTVVKMNPMPETPKAENLFKAQNIPSHFVCSCI